MPVPSVHHLDHDQEENLGSDGAEDTWSPSRIRQQPS